jgi:hypothetical protein
MRQSNDDDRPTADGVEAAEPIALLVEQAGRFQVHLGEGRHG